METQLTSATSEAPENQGSCIRNVRHLPGSGGEAEGVYWQPHVQSKGGGAVTINATFRLETPEHVALRFELAGPGSRFCAWSIDAALMFLVFVALLLMGLLVFGMGSVFDDFIEGNWDRALWGWALALLVLLQFLITTSYHLFFEGIMRGQTPGKKKLQIRAIREDGTAMGTTELLLRNLLRIADFLPVFYGLGGLVCWWHPRHKRLGDLAAGTIVVRESGIDYRAKTDRNRAEPEYEVSASHNTRLTSDEREMILSFLRRRDQLTLEARQRVADRLAVTLHQKYGGERGEPELYLQRLLGESGP